MNGTLSHELAAAGWFSQIQILTLAALPPHFQNLMDLLAVAPKLRILTIDHPVFISIPVVEGTATLLEGFQLTHQRVELSGNCELIQDVLGSIILQGVEFSVFHFTSNIHEVPASKCLELLVQQCPNMERPSLGMWDREGDDMEDGYTRDGGFMKPLAGFSKLRQLDVRFKLPTATREGLCSLLTRMPALTDFSGVHCEGVCFTEIMVLPGSSRRIHVTCDEPDED